MKFSLYIYWYGVERRSHVVELSIMYTFTPPYQRIVLVNYFLRFFLKQCVTWPSCQLHISPLKCVSYILCPHCRKARQQEKCFRFYLIFLNSFLNSLFSALSKQTFSLAKPFWEKEVTQMWRKYHFSPPYSTACAGWDQVAGEGCQVPGGGQQAVPGGQGHGGRTLLQQVPLLLPPPRPGGVQPGAGTGQGQGGPVRRSGA